MGVAKLERMFYMGNAKKWNIRQALSASMVPHV